MQLTEDTSYLSHEHTGINGQFVLWQTLVTTNLRTEMPQTCCKLWI